MRPKRWFESLVDSGLHEYIFWAVFGGPELAAAKFAFDHPDYLCDVINYAKFRWIRRNSCSECLDDKLYDL